jgi:hypothetical protein
MEETSLRGGEVLGIIGFVCWCFGVLATLVHAFRKSIKDGIYCLTIFPPIYLLFYAYAEYEGPSRRLVMLLVFGGLALVVVGSAVYVFG